MSYKVIGLYKRSRNDCEGITQDCKSYAAAAALREEWKSSNKFRSVCIVKTE